MKANKATQNTRRTDNLLKFIGKPIQQAKLFIESIVPAASMTVIALCITVLSEGSIANESLHNVSEITDEITEDYGRDYPRSAKTDYAGIDGWAVSFDNDGFIPGGRDHDYTYGMNITIVGEATKDFWVSPSRPLHWINQAIGIEHDSQDAVKQLFEFGLYGFTPEDISVSEPLDSDRPYASIIYATSIQELKTPNPNTSWRTSLTLGVLGLDLAGDVQDVVHAAIDSQDPKGWDNQISNGGELTARYSVAHQRLWKSPLPGVEIKSTSQGSIGYLTEASYSISLRIGKIATRWQSFNPEVASYGEQSNQSVDEKYKPESYWMLGAAVKARAYNAFLQGQFRDSDVTYDREDLNAGILEAWIGYSYGISNSYRLTYLLRGHTSEIKSGDGDRNVIWGGLTLSRKF